MTDPIMITETYLCRRFADLSDEDKRRVTNSYGDYNTTHDWWDCTCENFVADMDTEHAIWVDMQKIYFSGFYSQGDGLTFEATLDPAVFLISQVNNLPDIHKEAGRIVLAALRAEQIELEFTCKNYSQYAHGYAQGAELGICWIDSELEDNKQTALTKAVDELSLWLDEFCKEKAKELWRTLRDEYEYLTGEEAMAESFDANDCVFEIGTGRMFHYHEGE